MSPTVFMYPIKTSHLVARRYYMVPTQGGVSFPFEYDLFYCLLLLPGIMSDQNTTMLAQPPHSSDICQITHQQLSSPLYGNKRTNCLLVW